MAPLIFFPLRISVPSRRELASITAAVLPFRVPAAASSVLESSSKLEKVNHEAGSRWWRGWPEEVKCFSQNVLTHNQETTGW